MKFIQDKFGGVLGIHYSGSKNSGFKLDKYNKNRRTRYQLQIGKRIDVYNLTQKMIPYLILKKELAKAFLNAINKYGLDLNRRRPSELIKSILNNWKLDRLKYKNSKDNNFL